MLKIIKIIRIVLLVAIILVVAAFTALNAQSVEVKYLIGTRTLPLAVVCFISLISGLLIGFLIMLGKVLRLKKQVFLLNYKKNHEHKEIEIN